MRNRSPRAFRLLCAAFLLLITAGSWPAVAQGPTGVIEGVVRDEQGGVLPGVAMTLRNAGHWRHAHAGDGTRRPLQLPGALARQLRRARRAGGFATTEAQVAGHHHRHGAAPGLHDAGSGGRRDDDGRRRIAGRRHDEGRSVGHRDQGADRNTADQFAPVSLPGAPGPRHDGRRHEVVFRHGQCRRVDDLQRDRQRRRRHDQQLGGRR